MDAASGSLRSDYAYRAVTGGVGGASRVATLGNNPDVDTTTVPEDIWAGAEIGILNGIDHKFVQLPQSAVAMSLWCANAGDTAAGAGLRSVSVTYLDASRVSKTVTLATNGNTEVPLPENALRINVLRGLTSGTYGGSNLGPIHIRAAGGAGATYAYMQTGVGFARTSLFSVPAGLTFDVLGTVQGINRVDTADRWAVWALCLQTSAGFLSKPLVLPISTMTPDRHESSDVPITSVPSGTDVWIRCEGVSANNTDMTNGLFGYTRSGPVT